MCSMFRRIRIYALHGFLEIYFRRGEALPSRFPEIHVLLYCAGFGIGCGFGIGWGFGGRVSVCLVHFFLLLERLDSFLSKILS